jgi:hypothetical protein
MKAAKKSMGCELTGEGYIKVKPSHGTTVNGVFVCAIIQHVCV